MLEDRTVNKVMERFTKIPNLLLLGNNKLSKVPIFSFVISTKEGKMLNPQIVTCLFNDLFGIQTRSGCACAAMYGAALLQIDSQMQQMFKEATISGNDVLKPGFTRLNFIYFFTDEEIDYVLWATEFICMFGWMFLPKYKLNLEKKSWFWKGSEDPGIVNLDDIDYSSGVLQKKHNSNRPFKLVDPC